MVAQRAARDRASASRRRSSALRLRHRSLAVAVGVAAIAVLLVGAQLAFQRADVIVTVVYPLRRRASPRILLTARSTA